MTLEEKQADMRLRQADAKKWPRAILAEERDAAIYDAIRDENAGVYIIGSTEYGWYKIGQSIEVRDRAGSYRSLPFVLDTKRMWRVSRNDCRRIEIALHALVEDHRLRANGGYSEWFALSPDDVSMIDQFMSDQGYQIVPDYAAPRSYPQIHITI